MTLSGALRRSGTSPDPVGDITPLTVCKVAGAYANNAQQCAMLSIALTE